MLSLKIGAVNEQVQVEANAALVETQATGVGNVMETQRILELPLNGREATDLIQYTGAAVVLGTAGNGGFPGTEQFSIAGGQAFGVAFWLDGSVYNNPWDLANMPLPFPDALQEFKVETSSLTAQNGVHAGGTVTGVTVSGSNNFHGDAFDFLRNGDMNARNFFAPTRDTLKQNQFGGTIGGPVDKEQVVLLLRLSGHDYPPGSHGEHGRYFCSDSGHDRRQFQRLPAGSQRRGSGRSARFHLQPDSQQHHSRLRCSTRLL